MKTLFDLYNQLLQKYILYSNLSSVEDTWQTYEDRISKLKSLYSMLINYIEHLEEISEDYLIVTVEMRKQANYFILLAHPGYPKYEK